MLGVSVGRKTGCTMGAPDAAGSDPTVDGGMAVGVSGRAAGVGTGAACGGKAAAGVELAGATVVAGAFATIAVGGDAAAGVVAD